MANIWDDFDKAIDTEGLAKDVEEAAENGGRREVPHDTYEVAITKLELVKSKKGDPMVTCWMKILEGEYKGSLIFMNQVVTQGFQIHNILINESEAIANCSASVGILSDETIIGMHPWVDDPQQELERLKKQKEEEQAEFERQQGYNPFGQQPGNQPPQKEGEKDEGEKD